MLAKRPGPEVSQVNWKELTLTLTMSPQHTNLSTSWEAGIRLPMLEVGRLKLAEVMPLSTEPASGEVSLDPGLPSSKAFFHVTHEERTWSRLVTGIIFAKPKSVHQE